MSKRVINIQEALSLPPMRNEFHNLNFGTYCAWGAAFKDYDFMGSSLDCGELLMKMNDRGEFDKARRLVIQLILEKGFATPADSDLELARELMKEKANV